MSEAAGARRRTPRSSPASRRSPGGSGWRSSATSHIAKAGHLGGPLSAADMLAALYFHVLRIRPDDPGWPDRDRFVLSKGHSSIGLYAAMALRGYFPVEELATFDAAHSRLQGHPDMTRLPGLDMSTGSLGMGISAGDGHGARRPAHGPRRARLRDARRRRVPGGRGLGGRHGRPPATASTTWSRSSTTTSSSSSAGRATVRTGGSRPRRPASSSPSGPPSDGG